MSRSPCAAARAAVRAGVACVVARVVVHVVAPRLGHGTASYRPPCDRRKANAGGVITLSCFRDVRRRHRDEAVAQVVRPGALVVPPRLGLTRARLRCTAVGVRSCFGSIPALPFLLCPSLGFVRQFEQAGAGQPRA